MHQAIKNKIILIRVLHGLRNKIIWNNMESNWLRNWKIIEKS